MSSLPDARYEALVEALGVARPRASGDLRARVAALGGRAATDRAAPRSPRARLRLSWRPALVLAPVVVAGVAVGLALDATPGGRTGDAAEGGGVAASTVAQDSTEDPAGADVAGPRARFDRAVPGMNWSSAQASGGQGRAQAYGRATGATARRAFPPSGRRLQDYRADLRVRVSSLDDLSGTTTRAMRIARGLGGFVVSADYASPGDGDGDSRLVVRVPVDKVSEAVLRFAGLGTVVAQQVSIQDLQATFNAQSRRLDALRGTVAELERELRRTDLDVDTRIRLRGRLANARAQLAAAIGARNATGRRGRLATVSLTLTTREGAELQPPAPPGSFERTLRDALGVLGTAATWLLAALIVAGPFALLAALGVALERRRRRRAERRLLEQTA